MSIKKIINKVYIEGRSRKSFKKGEEVIDQACQAIKDLFVEAVATDKRKKIL